MPFLRIRENQGHPGPAFRPVLHPEHPAVLGDYLLDDTQAQPHPFFLGGEKGGKDFLQVFRRNPRSVVLHPDFDPSGKPAFRQPAA
jgi:hypothetical protein